MWLDGKGRRKRTASPTVTFGLWAAAGEALARRSLPFTLRNHYVASSLRGCKVQVKPKITSKKPFCPSRFRIFPLLLQLLRKDRRFVLLFSRCNAACERLSARESGCELECARCVVCGLRAWRACNDVLAGLGIMLGGAGRPLIAGYGRGAASRGLFGARGDQQSEKHTTYY